MIIIIIFFFDRFGQIIHMRKTGFEKLNSDLPDRFQIKLIYNFLM